MPGLGSSAARSSQPQAQGPSSSTWDGQGSIDGDELHLAIVPPGDPGDALEVDAGDVADRAAGFVAPARADTAGLRSPRQVAADTVRDLVRIAACPAQQQGGKEGPRRAADRSMSKSHFDAPPIMAASDPGVERRTAARRFGPAEVSLCPGALRRNQPLKGQRRRASSRPGRVGRRLCMTSSHVRAGRHLPGRAPGAATAAGVGGGHRGRVFARHELPSPSRGQTPR
jgi:hypothetical protein